MGSSNEVISIIPMNHFLVRVWSVWDSNPHFQLPLSTCLTRSHISADCNNTERAQASWDVYVVANPHADAKLAFNSSLPVLQVQDILKLQPPISFDYRPRNRPVYRYHVCGFYILPFNNVEPQTNSFSLKKVITSFEREKVARN